MKNIFAKRILALTLTLTMVGGCVFSANAAELKSDAAGETSTLLQASTTSGATTTSGSDTSDDSGATTTSGSDTGTGDETDPGTSTGTGDETDPGTSTDSGEETDPGTSTDSGEETDPGSSTDPDDEPEVTVPDCYEITIKPTSEAKSDLNSVLQPYLDEAAENATAEIPYVITIQKGTYTLSKALCVYSNTTIVATGCTIKLESTTATHMLQSGRPSKESYTGYDAFKNIVIKGGTWNTNGPKYSKYLGHEGRVIVQMAHVTGLTVQGITFKGSVDNHTMEVAACEDVLVKNCVFDGVSVNYKNSSAREALQLDLCDKNYGSYYTSGEPVLSVHNMEVTRCTFKKCICGVGSHKVNTSDPFSNISIHDNTFTDIKTSAITSTKISHDNVAINVQNMVNSSVCNNTVKNCGGTAIRVSDNCRGTVVKNNVISGCVNKGIMVLNDVTPKNCKMAEITGNTISNITDGAGIQICGATVTTIANNTVSNTLTGIVLMKQKVKCHVTSISSNKVYSARKSGVNIQKSTVGSLDGNFIKGSKKAGVSVEKTKITDITNNTVKGSKVTGMQIIKSSSVTNIANNTIKNTGKNAIAVYGKSQVSSINNNAITKAKKHGISIYGSSKVTAIKANSVVNIKEFGILMASKSKVKRIVKNTVTGCKRYGIYVMAGTRANKIAGNKVKKCKKKIVNKGK
ncbi:MAG: right-handed parallel beta-helix repeat-containing protein [Eubacterium sp.]|nr:right-handed parallel beta-helix repeat-containing protein [Eubacterium sp.]